MKTSVASWVATPLAICGVMASGRTEVPDLRKPALDHGDVLRTGQERVGIEELRGMLESRFPGIQTSDMTVTPVIGPQGSPVKSLHEYGVAVGLCVARGAVAVV
jgi:hypothetical protein